MAIEIVKGNIGQALHSLDKNHIVTTADEIYDEGRELRQSEINQLVKESNFKKINGVSVFGPGDISVEGGGEVFDASRVLFHDSTTSVAGKDLPLLKYEAQNLSEAQKLQVRKNIGVEDITGMDPETETKINTLWNWFKEDAEGNIYTDKTFYSKKNIAAYGKGAENTGSGNAVNLYKLPLSQFTEQYTDFALSAAHGKELSDQIVTLSAKVESVSAPESSPVVQVYNMPWSSYNSGYAAYALSAARGYDLYNALTTAESNINTLLQWFKLDADGNLYTTKNFYSQKSISAYGSADVTIPTSTVNLYKKRIEDFSATDSDLAVRASDVYDLHRRVLTLESTGATGGGVSGGGSGDLALGVVEGTAYPGNLGALNASNISSLQALTNTLNSNYTALTGRVSTLESSSSSMKTNLDKLLSWFKIDSSGNVYTEKNFYSTKEISAYGGTSTAQSTVNVYKKNLSSYTSADADLVIRASEAYNLYQRVAALETGSPSGESTGLILGTTSGTAYPGEMGSANAANISALQTSVNTLKGYFSTGVAKQAAKTTGTLSFSIGDATQTTTFNGSANRTFVFGTAAGKGVSTSLATNGENLVTESAVATYVTGLGYVTKTTADSTYLQKSGGTMTGTLTARNINPSANNTYSLGSTSYRWANIFVNNIKIGDATISYDSTAGAVKIDKPVYSTGEITSFA